MRYTFLGKSGLRVSELCLGAMTFGEDWIGGTSKEESKAIFDAYVTAGGNFIDTANIYTNGTSEKLVGEFIAGSRDQYVLATKYSISTNPSDPNASGNHRKNIIRAVEASLKRLKTDYIDLYWVHIWDGVTPYEEMMRGLEDLVRAGKVLYLGASDMPAWVVSQSNVLAELRGWTQFVGLQIEYSLGERTPEGDLIPMAAAHGMSILDWSPLKMGVLTGKYLGNGTAESVSYRLNKPSLDAKLQGNYLNERVNRIAREVVAVAGEIGRSPAQVALNWILSQSPLHIPILGAQKRAHLEDNMGCTSFQLDAAQLHRLEEVSRPQLVFPHSFLKLDHIQESVLGAGYKQRLVRTNR
jgi:aryl-alcohol dehydrogenase-like predicted oxidoreductase